MAATVSREGRPRKGALPFRERGTPVEDGRSAALKVYPGLQITDNARPTNSALGRANPRSFHVQTRAAIDARPIPGMTFEQYVKGYRDAGYAIIEARDEVKNPSKHATGPHWHVVLGK
jgi:soluble lytic murein transglycosylase